jgi:Flp pilus assembly protein TadG
MEARENTIIRSTPRGKVTRGSRVGLFRRGNAVMEMALVLPILLALSFGTVEFGYFFYVKHTLQGAARDGARQAILPSATNSTVTTAVSTTMSAAGFTGTQYTTTITNALTNATVADISAAASGTPFKVTVTATWGTVGVRPMGLISTTKQVIGFTIMVKE